MVFLHIQSECGKIRTRQTPTMDTFHVVDIRSVSFNLMKQRGSLLTNIFFGSINEKYDGKYLL